MAITRGSILSYPRFPLGFGDVRHGEESVSGLHPRVRTVGTGLPMCALRPCGSSGRSRVCVHMHTHAHIYTRGSLHTYMT